MRICLIATVLNEAESIDAFLSAIDSQSKPVDEVVIVDGGSVDGTKDHLEAWAEGRDDVKIVSAPGANIATGRNLAIEQARSDAIAVTDAGAAPDPGWLDAITAPLVAGEADVVMGFYRGDPRSTFEMAQDCLNLPDADEVDPSKFMPSSRSVAFRRDIWERAGGYPTWLDIGEDMYFNFAVLKTGAARVFAPGAVVRWRMRPTFKSFVVQYYRYARGDAIAGMYPRRHAIRFAAYTVAAAALVLTRPYPALIVAPVIGGAVWMRRPFIRASSRARGKRAAVMAMLPFMHVAMDLAKMAGYLAGRARRLKGRT